MKNLYLIAAIAKNNEIGYNNKLLWTLKEDLQFFKNKTSNAYILMGSRTYDSLPGKLPNRKYLVLDNTSREYDKDIIKLSSLDEALNFIKNNDEIIYVIGGGMVYKLMLPYVDTMYLTELENEYSYADTFFPEFDKDDFERTVDDLLKENDINYRHVTYKRINNFKSE